MSALIGMLRQEIEMAHSRLARFVGDIEINPTSALEWSASVFEAAATKQVFAKIEKLLNEGMTVAALLGYAQREVNIRAKRGSRSTSEASNLMEAELMSAWARGLQMLQDDGGVR